MSDPTSQDDLATLPVPSGHWRLFRDLAALQFKLALDGVLDLVLSPASIVAAVAGLILSPDNPGKYFYRVLRFGHRSDKWINLYGVEAPPHPDTATSDQYVRKVEEIIRTKYDKGGVVKSLKDNTDNLIDRMRNR